MTETPINWKTIKIPETVRDAAREDDRTYGEIMQAGLDADTTPRTHELLSDVGADPDEIADAVARRFDYAEVARQTADEVEGRLR